MGKITKLTYNFSVKKSKNYNSVESSEGFELATETMADTERFHELKKVLQERVHAEVNRELEKLPEKKDYLTPKKTDELEGL